MNIKAEILKEHSKTQTVKIADYIGKDEAKFKLLMECFFSSENRLAQRASWVVSSCCGSSPELINPYLKKMVSLLDKDVHDAVKRNTVRILQSIDIPDKLQGEVLDKCFALLSNKATTVAIKAFSMTVLSSICKSYPELREELKVIIEDQIEYEKPGFVSRGRKVLKELGRIE